MGYFYYQIVDPEGKVAFKNQNYACYAGMTSGTQNLKTYINQKRYVFQQFIPKYGVKGYGEKNLYLFVEFLNRCGFDYWLEKVDDDELSKRYSGHTYFHNYSNFILHFNLEKMQNFVHAQFGLFLSRMLIEGNYDFIKLFCESLKNKFEFFDDFQWFAWSYFWLNLKCPHNIFTIQFPYSTPYGSLRPGKFFINFPKIETVHETLIGFNGDVPYSYNLGFLIQDKFLVPAPDNLKYVSAIYPNQITPKQKEAIIAFYKELNTPKQQQEEEKPISENKIAIKKVAKKRIAKKKPVLI